MIDVGVALFSNVGLLAAVALVYSVVVYHFHGMIRSVLVGLLLGSGAILSMLYPVEVVPGVIVDARTTMVMLAGFFGGPLAAIVTLVIAGAYRLFLGGVGVTAGLVSLCIAAMIGLVCHIAFASRGRRVMVWHLLLLALVSPLVSLAVLALPWETMREVIQKAFIPASLVRAGGLIFLGVIMLHEQRRVIAEARIRELSYIDELSGLSNRRDFYASFDREWVRWTRSGTPFALMLIDIDNFKSINDRYGHPAGDEVIRTLARVLRRQSRPGDVCARIGGEEFVLLTPGMQMAAATGTAERVRRAVERELVKTDSGEIRFTVSIGVVGDVSAYPSREKAMSAGDQALYVAKRDGRNRVVSGPLSMTGGGAGPDASLNAKPAV